MCIPERPHALVATRGGEEPEAACVEVWSGYMKKTFVYAKAEFLVRAGGREADDC